MSSKPVFGIYDYLPTHQTENLPLILLTSQTTDWRSFGYEVILITWLSEREATECLFSAFKIDQKQLEKDENLQKLLECLLKKLGGYPLALGLAGGL